MRHEIENLREVTSELKEELHEARQALLIAQKESRMLKSQNERLVHE